MELALVGLLIVCLLPGSAASDEQPAIQMALIVESTVGTGRDGFYGERAMIAALLKELNDSDISATIINTGDSAVTHGNLTTLAAASKLASELQYLDGKFFNLQDALEKTEALLSFADQTVVKLVVVVTAGDVRCPLRRETRGKNVCRLVDHLKRSGASFGTIALHYHDVPNPVITIAPECARMSSDGALPTDFRRFIQRSRCLFSADGNADLVCGALCAVTPSPQSQASETLKVEVDAQLPRLNVAVPSRSLPSTVALRGTRQCSSDLSKLWLDMVIIFDSTFGVGYEGFKGSIAMIDGIVSTMRIGAFDGHHTRLGVVNLGATAEQIAGLDDLGSTEQASKVMGGMKYRGDFQLNVEEGFLKAIEILILPRADPLLRSSLSF